MFITFLLVLEYDLEFVVATEINVQSVKLTKPEHI